MRIALTFLTHVLFTALFITLPARGQEIGVRGVWITNVDSEVLHSRERIESAMRYLSDTGFNVVYPVVWNKAHTLFPSPTLQAVTGEKQDPFFAEDARVVVAAEMLALINRRESPDACIYGRAGRSS